MILLERVGLDSRNAIR